MRRGGRPLARVREMGLFRQRPSLLSGPRCCSPPVIVRTVRVVRVPLRELLDVAHAHGATLNDVVLTAVAGALFDLLAGQPW